MPCPVGHEVAITTRGGVASRLRTEAFANCLQACLPFGHVGRGQVDPAVIRLLGFHNRATQKPFTVRQQDRDANGDYMSPDLRGVCYMALYGGGQPIGCLAKTASVVLQVCLSRWASNSNLERRGGPRISKATESPCSFSNWRSRSSAN